MKRAGIAALAALALTGCGDVVGGARADMITVCRDSGETHEKCTCIANTMQEKLEPETFDKMAVAVTGGDEAVTTALAELPPEQAEAAIYAIADASLSCL